MTKPPAKTENVPTWAAELTPRERRFVEEYIVDLNGRAAAVRAGLGKTVKSATEIASRMRRKSAVAAAISHLIGERSGTTSAAVLTEIARIAFAKMPDYARVVDGSLIITDTADLTEDQQAAISEITETVTEHGRTVKVKLHDKLAALVNLAKVLRMYQEREAPRDDSRWNGDALVSARQKLTERLERIAKKLAADPDMQVIPPARQIAPFVPVKTIDAE